jgi:hypothetical protein
MATIPGTCVVHVNGEALEFSHATAVAVQAEIADYMIRRRKAWEESQREAGQVWKVRYWVHHSDYEEEAYSFEDAVGILVPAEYGDLAPESITCPDGTVLDSDACYRLTEAAVSR